MKMAGNLAFAIDGSETLDLRETPQPLKIKRHVSENDNEEMQDHDKFVDLNGQQAGKSSTRMIPQEIQTKMLVPTHGPSPNQDGFTALQKWEGYVTSVKKDTFESVLVCMKGEGPDQFAEICVEDVSIDDQPLIDIGAVFYWSIGYLEKAPGQRLRSSLIRFRRLPAWTPRELAKAEARAKELEDILSYAE